MAVDSMAIEHTPPFSKGYVVNHAVNDAKASVDKSINYATRRLKDFPSGSEKWREILDTLHVLHEMRKMLDDFVKHNPHLFNTDNPLNGDSSNG